MQPPIPTCLTLHPISIEQVYQYKNNKLILIDN